MKYNKSIMLKLINEHRELHDELKMMKKEMELEKNLAVKALYHSAVADGGRYMQDYQDLESCVTFTTRKSAKENFCCFAQTA